MKSVKTKIIVLVLSCIVFSSAAVGGASIINSRRVVEADSTQILNLLCENRTEEIDALLTRIEQSVETLMVYASHQMEDIDRFQTDAAYVDAYTDSLLEVAVNAAQNTEGSLAVYIRYNPEFTAPQSGIFCSRDKANGSFQVLTPTNLAIYDPSDREHVGWFYEPALKKSGLWMAPYFNQNIGVEMISYTIPYFVDNIFVGVVGMDIDLDTLKGVISNTEVYESGYAFLTDSDAKIVYHQQLSMGMDLMQLNHGEFEEAARTLKTDTTNGKELIAYTYRGEPRKASFHSLSNGMRLVLTAPTSEIDAQANSLILQIVAAVLLIVGAAVVLTVLFTRRLVKPLLELNNAAKKIADGDLSVSITHHSSDEVGTLAESFRQTVAHLHKYISYINELAYRDSLTGVKNKTAYLEIVNKMDEMTRLKRPVYAVAVFDINELKKVNDTRGHDFGDILISNACKMICRVFKRSPIYRIGGDEFVALLENSDYDHYSELLDQFAAEVEAYNQDSKNELKISIARGIALFSEETDLTFNDVFKRADNAMYHNKQEMKNRLTAAEN